MHLQNLTTAEYEDIQRYQDETGIQVIYPTLREEDKPEASDAKKNANYYFKTESGGRGQTRIVYDENGNVIPVYWKYAAGTHDDGYTSRMRIEGEDGFEVDGQNTITATAASYPRDTSAASIITSIIFISIRRC